MAPGEVLESDNGSEATVNASGLLLVILGIWATVQVLGGHALERLGIVTS
jgi:hypothetical protein